MTQNTDFNRPFNNLVSYVPKALRNSMNTSVLDNLFNRFMSHDESIPLYGYIGKKPANINDKTPAVPQPSVERGINTIAPIISFNVGTTKHLFTFQDLMNRAKALGISENLSWLYSQGNNFVPPINIDKFTNFYNYYWIPKSTLGPSWNPNNVPEYYVIAKPKLTDQIKLNVKVTTTKPIVLSGTGFKAQQFSVSFISSEKLIITTSGENLGWTPVKTEFVLNADVLETAIEYKLVNDDTGEFKTLLSFDLVREYLFNASGEISSISKFNINDQFIIDAPFISKNYSTTFSGSPGVKGKIVNIKSLAEYQLVNNVILQENDRILVKDNIDAENGIWVVRPRDWIRASDFDNETAVNGSLVYVEQGFAHNFSLWKSLKTTGGHTFTREEGFNVSKTNDWQENNFWAHASVLKANNINKNSVKQASRPIIEFDSSLELNEHVHNGKPSNTGTFIRSSKSEFNQLPLFNLYRYDGTHANKVSSIFFYQEDEKASLDTVLQKRVKKSNNDSGDFIFSHGCVDENGSMLFFKTENSLKTVWKKGYSEPTVAHTSFSGVGNGQIIKFIPAFNAQQQIWTFEAISNNTFKIIGSKNNAFSEHLVVGVLFKCEEFECAIINSTIPFNVGDTFKVAVGNLERPRYVAKYENDEIKDFNGGFSNDFQKLGAYQVARTFTNNPYNLSSADISEGTLYSHFRSILGNQISDELDFAFGGNIKLWSEQHTLLASLLMQEDLTPSSMISFAHREYEQAINAVKEIFSKNFLEYISDIRAPKNASDISDLVDWILEQRSQDHDVKTVLFDSTSPVKGFPPTLPLLGILPLVTPKIEFDKSLSTILLTHHDGHKSPIFTDTNEFRQTILGRYIDINILRSNNTYTPVIGSFTGTAPARPFKGELWISPNGNEQTIFVFDVLSDSEQPETANNGEYYFDRQNNRLFLRFNNEWVNQPTNAAWKKLDMAEILNLINLEIENRLANGINPAGRKIDFSQMLINKEFKALLEKEFYSFAAFNKYDPLAPKFSANDPFTWNYSEVSVFNSAASLPLEGHDKPARWNEFLIAHQRAVFNSEERYTERPDLEPWKLLGYSSLDEWKAPATLARSPTIPWNANYESVFRNFDKRQFFDGGSVKAVKVEHGSTLLSGEPIIDGIQINFNDLILLVNENDRTKNGIWRVTPNGWTRGPRELTQYLSVSVSGGIIFKNTKWALLNNVNILETDVIDFRQIRSWSTEMWDDIKSGIGEIFKTSVNNITDELLPPYVNENDIQRDNALTTFIPAGIANGYKFGEMGPVENVWRKTSDFGYSLARALFKYDPISFLGFCWGFNWVTVNGISFDGDTMQLPGHKRFKLHGDAIDTTSRKLSNLRSININALTLSVTFDAYGLGGKQLFSIKRNDKIIAVAIEGEIASIKDNLYELNFLIEDSGIPFNIGDTFLINVENNNISYNFIPSKNHKIQGFGQIFTQALRNISIDNNNSYAINAFRNWEVNMGYRASGLVATDDLKIRTDAETLSTNSFSLLFKKNKLSQTFWIQALRIQLVKTNKFTEDVNGLIYPVETGDDWTFRVEGFNPRHLDITYYDMVLSETMTFNALSKENTDIEWLQPLTKIKTINTQLPLEIRGIQNVINFLFGYKNYLEDSGWEFNKRDKFNIDAETGRKRSFQLEIEKFVDSCFGGIKIGQGHIVNPFMDKIWLKHDKGLLSTFDDNSLFDISGHPGIYDVNGTRINAADIKAIRTNQISEVSSDVPMFSAQFQIDEFEHVFVFNNFAQPSTKSGLLYDPFSGAKVITYKINGRRQANFSMRPEFGGHYLVGNEVKQNLQASTDNVSNFYNTNTVFENEKTTNHALALLGFNNKKYFDDLDINNASQFNFWRGLVHSKGTYSSILAYLNNGRFDDAKIDEYWAFKVAEYGDARQKTKPELRLSVNDTLQQFTKLQFDPSVGVWNKSVNKNGELPGFTIISSADENRWFSIDDMDHDTYFDAEIVGDFKKTLINNDVIKLPFIADRITGAKDFDIINSTTLRSYLGGESDIVGYGPSASKYNPLKLFNYIDNELVADISVWNPAAGFHTPIALESINIISNTNPAKFNYSTQITNNKSYDPLRPWSDKELGRIWLDTTKLEYVPYYDEIIFPLLDDRLNRWGALAEYATVDVYEWVKSTIPPQEYNKKALTDAGNSEIDISIRAAGIVAAPETYKRSRDWGIYPVAWSYSPLLIEEGHPAFNSSFESAINMNDVQNDGSKPAELKLFLDGGVIWLESGSFADFGITAGMRIGAWDPDPEYPKPLSEMKITNTFFKKPFRDGSGNTGTGAIVEQSTAGVPSTIKITIAENSPLRGRVLFSAHPITAIEQENENAPTWKIPVRLKVTEIDSGQSETISLNTGIGTEFDQPAIEARPSIPFQDAIPAQPAKASYLAIIGFSQLSSASATGISPTYSVLEPDPNFVPDPNNPNAEIPKISVQKPKNYTTVIAIDGIEYLISATGSDVTTWGGIAAKINSEIGRAVASIEPITFKDSDGNKITQNHFIIKGTSTTAAVASVRIITSGFFADTTNVYKYITQGAIGETPGTPAQQAAAAIVGQPAFYTDAYHGAKLSVQSGQTLTYESDLFKMTILVTVLETGVYDLGDIQKAIISTVGAEGSPIIFKDAVEVEIIVPLGIDDRILQPNVLSNNTFDAEYEDNNGIGWRAWSVPSQEQLDNDGMQPNSAWKPYIGPLYSFVNGDATINFVREAIEYLKKPLTLNDGTIIQKYETTWEDWKSLKDIKLSATNIEVAVTDMVFSHTELIDPTRTSVYINGIAQLKASFIIDGRNIKVLNVKRGHEVVIIIRKYEPREEEILFNPEIEENFLYQHQFKKDYEYVTQDVRGTDGNLTNKIYYFWVKNRTSAPAGKRLSAQTITQELMNGPSTYLTFQNLLAATETLPNRYTALVIAGLNFLVTKDNTFKLRFTRDFTLRDNPEDLNLKDTHTEWSLMRENQNSRIPTVLWNKMIDSAAGIDSAGNDIPSLRRILYDERNKTRTQFGFNNEQTLAPAELLRSSILFTILNTKIVNTLVDKTQPDYINFLNFNESDMWFSDADSTRKTLSAIWLNAKTSQINEIFFAALNDMLACNYELSDIFKTSRLSAYSIKLVPIPAVSATYE